MNAPPLRPQRDRVLRLFRPGAELAAVDVAEQLDIKLNNAQQVLSRLHRDGLLERPEKGQYRRAGVDHG